MSVRYLHRGEGRERGKERVVKEEMAEEEGCSRGYIRRSGRKRRGGPRRRRRRRRGLRRWSGRRKRCGEEGK